MPKKNNAWVTGLVAKTNNKKVYGENAVHELGQLFAQWERESGSVEATNRIIPEIESAKAQCRGDTRVTRPLLRLSLNFKMDQKAYADKKKIPPVPAPAIPGSTSAVFATLAVPNQPVAPKAEEVKTMPVVVANKDPLSALKRIKEMVCNYEDDIPAAMLAADIAKLKDAPRGDEFWKCINDGLMGGFGESYFVALKKYGVWDMLFPHRSEEAEQNEKNDAWFQSRLHLIDLRHENDRKYETHASTLPALLIARELSALSDDDELTALHGTLQTPVVNDPNLYLRVKYHYDHKQEFLTGMSESLQDVSDAQVTYQRR
ncbi:MAG TPA: hypothetical protein VLJ15_03195 [Gammaproteobacteria bacterium]|nr:hypothetical protein [Gammaproteobacteria bacterium]